MKIGILSDTHISDNDKKIPPEVLEGLKGVDMIIHAGDLLDLSVIDTLRSICPNIKAVSGNMDGPEIKDKFLQKEIFKVCDYKIGIMHGYGAPVNLIELLKDTFKNDDIDIIIFGHSHTPFNENIDGILFFNPGSPTDKMFAPYNSYGIIEINDKIEAKIIKIK
ncbi:MAG: metallophosphatase family protein [Candidatus Omnitrophica bacterium]|nr:metallophosphatase family protein [Candidatus Omnitrophota bacterium]